MSNYLTNLVRRGAGLAPPAGAAAVVPRRVPSWMVTGGNDLGEPRELPVVEGTAPAPVIDSPSIVPRESPSHPTEAPRPLPSPAFAGTADEPGVTEPEPPTSLPRAPLRQLTVVTPERVPLQPEAPPADPHREVATPPRTDERAPAVAAPRIRAVPRRSEAEVEPPRPTQVRPAAPVPAHQPRQEQPSSAPVAPGTPRGVRVEAVSASAEQPTVITPPRRPQADPFAPTADADRAAVRAAQPHRLPPTDRPALSQDPELQPSLAPPTLLRPAAPARAPEVGVEAIRDPQRVTIRIGTIEIRTEAPRQPPAAPLAALPPPAPTPAGFEAYTRLRTYAPWNLQDRP